MIETILELVALFILGGYLWIKHFTRLDARMKRAEELNWKVTPFDSAPLKPRLQAVRKDYTVAMGNHLPQNAAKPRLLSLARNFVGGLAYFRDRVPPETDRTPASSAS